MFLNITACDGIHILYFYEKSLMLKNGMNPPDQEELELTKEISKICWRLLKSPDFFWDDDVKQVLILREPDKETPRPQESVNFWPLWTVEDAASWISSAGCGVRSIYKFNNPEKHEIYFNLENGRIIFEKTGSLINCLLTFILKKIKGEYQGEYQKEKRSDNN